VRTLTSGGRAIDEVVDFVADLRAHHATRVVNSLLRGTQRETEGASNELPSFLPAPAPVSAFSWQEGPGGSALRLWRKIR
jgi:hypothetical protein